jgi:hypothetical protein
MVAIDAYELRARFAPALIIASPWLLVSVAVIQTYAAPLLTTSLAAVIFLAILYGFTFVVRHRGLITEKGLWDSWGGPPSAVILTESDPTFPKETKARIAAYVASELGVKNATNQSWLNEINRIQEAFRLVRQYLRQRDPNGLWFTHNAEYGFLRNLLGSWWLLLANAVAASCVCGVLWLICNSWTLLALIVINLILSLVAVAGRFLLFLKPTRTAAFRYAESAWLAFLTEAGAGKQTA